MNEPVHLLGFCRDCLVPYNAAPTKKPAFINRVLEKITMVGGEWKLGVEVSVNNNVVFAVVGSPIAWA